MRVLHIIAGLEVGGAENALVRLIEAQLGDDSVCHSVVSLSTRGELGQKLSRIGVKVIALGEKSVFGGARAFFKLRRILKDERPDVVQTWMYHSDLIGGLAARSVGIKSVVWGIRSTDIRKGGSRLTILVRLICAWLSKVIPCAIVCVAFASRAVHVRVGYEPSKIRIIPNGFRIPVCERGASASARVRESIDAKDDCILVLSVARYHPVKDHATFISAAGAILRKYPDVKYVLVGRDVDANNRELLELIMSTGRPDSFHLLGHRPDVVKIMQACDILCLHSVTEGFPNVLGEAMAVGLPCIATDVGDAGYLLENDDWMVPASSAEKLADKLESMLCLPASTRDTLGRVGRNRIQECFSIASVSQQYLDLYSEVSNSVQS